MMADGNLDKLPHLLVTGTASVEPYARPPAGGGELNLPRRNRRQHGRKLLAQLDQLRDEAHVLAEDQRAFGVDAGIVIQFESEPKYELALKSLEYFPSGIELLAVRQFDNKRIAAVFVPEAKLSRFIKQVTAYLEKETQTGQFKNRKLIESISEIRRAVLDALWTDNDPPPAENESIFWEVWLRAGAEREELLRTFDENARRLGLELGPQHLNFPDRTVVIARGSRTQMSQSVDLLNSVAELRKAKETADFFASMPASEQFEWIEDALQRIVPPPPDSPAVCILDTGVNNAHPLLSHSLADTDMHSYDPDWNTADHCGHGTEMAGLALYGDLTDLLASAGETELTHRLESVKILPPQGDNPPHLYGAITAEATARAEIAAPDRKRVFSMSVTTTDFRDRGQPSAWSAKLDALSSGAEEQGDQRRLIFVSVGNTDPQNRHLYPPSNETDQVHDPGQSWNAVTVGAFTEKTAIDPESYPEWTAVAPEGGLSPSSCTSLVWARPWPIKPDIVLEGGNMAINPGTGTADYIGSLQLLSSNWQFAMRAPLVVTGDTSAATAMAARMAAMLLAAYPKFWPETLRALLVHSAEWTDAMKESFAPLNTRTQKQNLLRYCGFGVPDLDRAMWSAKNSLTLVAQDSIQPFDKVGSSVRSRDMSVHRIPWPVEVLRDLEEAQVEMRVTLSYFIEPNPARRGWTNKHRYASHGLRFDVKTPTESLDEFRQRINKAARDEEYGKASTSDSARWFFGPDLRSLGSLHSDRWTGTAVELAERGFIAVYPVIGWWRERHQLGRWNKQARYSLVVTIRTPETEVDVYTPVANMIATQIAID
ncbi:MAG TPA: S8 family peptidase [Blastocatellia bacterium]|nr:S8 family peptidase [Blastocatellia bacterium]